MKLNKGCLKCCCRACMQQSKVCKVQRYIYMQCYLMMKVRTPNISSNTTTLYIVHITTGQVLETLAGVCDGLQCNWRCKGTQSTKCIVIILQY